MKAAVAHVQRHGTTSRGLTTVLERRVKKALREVAEAEAQAETAAGTGGAARDSGAEEEALLEALQWVSEVVTALEDDGSLNDRLYAELFARSLHRSGKSRRLIAGRLAQKGVTRELAERAIDLLADESESGDVDGDAAAEFARKRRFGPYRRPDIELDEARRRKELGAFARAGFGFDLAKKMVDADPDSETDDGAG